MIPTQDATIENECSERITLVDLQTTGIEEVISSVPAPTISLLIGREKRLNRQGINTPPPIPLAARKLPNPVQYEADEEYSTEFRQDFSTKNQNTPYFLLIETNRVYDGKKRSSTVAINSQGNERWGIQYQDVRDIAQKTNSVLFQLIQRKGEDVSTFYDRVDKTLTRFAEENPQDTEYSRLLKFAEKVGIVQTGTVSVLKEYN